MNIQQNFFNFLMLLFFTMTLNAGQIKVKNNFRNSDYFITIDTILNAKVLKIKNEAKDQNNNNAESEQMVSDKIPTLINRHHFKNQNNFLNGTYTNSIGYTKSFLNPHPKNTYLAKNIALSLINKQNTERFAPCHPTGATICPDVVELPILLTFNRYFILNSQDYLFELLGFNMDELDFKNEFVSEDDPMKRIRLYGKTTFLPDIVPAPSTFILFFTGLLVCFYQKRKLNNI